MKYIKEGLLGMWILLTPFQHGGMQHSQIGFLGASISFVPGGLLLMLLFIESLSGKSGLKISRRLLYVAGYMLVINVLYLILFGSESHGTNLFTKVVNLSVLTGLLVLPIFYFSYESPRLGKYIACAFLISICGVVLGDLLALDFFANGLIFHAGENLNMRPRGFALESSTLSAQVATLGLLAAHFTKRLLYKLAIVFVALLTLIYSGSRGGVLVAFITGIIVLITSSSMRTIWKVVVTGTLIMMVLVLMANMKRKFAIDIELYTSTSTRLGVVITALNSTLHNPLGVGFSGYLPAVDRYAPGAIAFLDNLTGSTLNFAELESYIKADTDINISTKTFLFDNFLYFGMPFVILFIVFHQRLLSGLNRQKQLWLYSAVLFSSIAISTYIGGLGMYNLSLLYGVAYSEVRRQEDSGSRA